MSDKCFEGGSSEGSEGSEGSKGSEGKVLRIDRPDGRRVLRFDGPSGRGLRIALRAMLMKSALRDWLSVSYSMKSILLISRCAAPPYPAAPDFLHGKACHTILRSLCFLTNRVPLPPHPGDRINRSMLSCRDMAPLLSTHSAPACGGKVVAPATKGGAPSPERAVVKVLYKLAPSII